MYMEWSAGSPPGEFEFTSNERIREAEGNEEAGEAYRTRNPLSVRPSIRSNLSWRRADDVQGQDCPISGPTVEDLTASPFQIKKEACPVLSLSLKTPYNRQA